MMRGAATQPTFGHFYVAPKKGSRHSQKNRQVKQPNKLIFSRGANTTQVHARKERRQWNVHGWATGQS